MPALLAGVGLGSSSAPMRCWWLNLSWAPTREKRVSSESEAQHGRPGH